MDRQMRSALGLVVALGIGGMRAGAQDLTPRAYYVTPVGSNAVTLSFVRNQGAVFLDPSIPVEISGAQINITTLSYYHAFDLLGRSANVVLAAPYGTGTLEGTFEGEAKNVYRSGLADGRVRFAVNLRGGPAMSPKQYSSWREKSTLGASFTLVLPTGQYYPSRLINAGANRWGMKPELGFTQRWGNWMLDTYGGAWFYTANKTYFPGASTRTQAPIPECEMHFGYYLRPRFWASLDANFWTGGASAINDIARNDEQRNSRLGVTVSIPAGPHHSFKFSYSAGAYVTIGGNYRTVSAAWQYSWLSKPE